jgi:hypothetical protein
VNEQNRPKLTRVEISRLGGFARAQKLNPEKLSELNRKGAEAINKAGVSGKFTSKTAQKASLKAKQLGVGGRFTSEQASMAAQKRVEKLKEQLSPEQLSERMRQLARRPRPTKDLFQKSERETNKALKTMDEDRVEFLKDLAHEAGEVTASKYRGTDFYIKNGRKSAQMRKIREKDLEEMLILGQ